MRALLKKYDKDTLIETKEVDLPEGYDGDPYGDTVPFVMASNWSLEVLEENASHQRHLPAETTPENQNQRDSG